MIYYDRNVKKAHKCMPTFYVTRGIREVIRNAGYDWRLYIFRAYFATALDSAQSKGRIALEWRAKFMGHKANIESTYSVNKKLSQEKIEEMREGYKRCEEYFTTAKRSSQEIDSLKILHEVTLNAFEIYSGKKFSEEERGSILNLSREEFNDKLTEISKKNKFYALNNGYKQNVIKMKEVDTFISQGQEYVSALLNNKARVSIPE